MKIGIDISQIVYQGSGVSRFTQGLTNAILKYDKKNRWFFFFMGLRKTLDPDLEGKILTSSHRLFKLPIPPTLSSIFFNHWHNFFKFLTFNFKFLTFLDWFIASDWAEIPLKTKKATIVHDLVYLRFPETVHPKIKKTQEKRLYWVKKEANIIFADSHSTKKDLINFLKINPERIVVNYPGIDVFQPTKNTIANTLKKYNLTNKKFILTVSKIEPRKNLQRLILAFDQLKIKDLKLIIVGSQGWGKIINQNNQNKNIKFLGYISDTELYSLYSSCLFFVFPSIWEGFGYPLIEAMTLGAASCCSNSSSLKEIANGASLFFDPFSINDIALKLNLMIKNEKLRNALIQKGIKNAKKFNWEKYYKKMINVLSKNIK
ncbi:MAG: glycosyltransferase family 4 protein [Microgenomates group bacterium]